MRIKLLLGLVLSCWCAFGYGMVENEYAAMVCRGAYKKVSLERYVGAQLQAFIAAGMPENRFFEFFHNFAYLIEAQGKNAFDRAFNKQNLSCPVAKIKNFTYALRSCIRDYCIVDAEVNVFKYKKIVYQAPSEGQCACFLVYEDPTAQETMKSWLYAYFHAYVYLQYYGLVHHSYYVVKPGDENMAVNKFIDWLYASIGRGDYALPLIQSKKAAASGVSGEMPTLRTITGCDRLMFTQNDVKAIGNSPVNVQLQDPDFFCYADFETMMSFFNDEIAPSVVQESLRNQGTDITSLAFVRVLNNVRAGGVGALVLNVNDSETGRMHAVFVGMRKEKGPDANATVANRVAVTFFDIDNLQLRLAMKDYQEPFLDFLQDYLEDTLQVGEYVEIDEDSHQIIKPAPVLLVTAQEFKPGGKAAKALSVAALEFKPGQKAVAALSGAAKPFTPVGAAQAESPSSVVLPVAQKPKNLTVSSKTRKSIATYQKGMRNVRNKELPVVEENSETQVDSSVDRIRHSVAYQNLAGLVAADTDEDELADGEVARIMMAELGLY